MIKLKNKYTLIKRFLIIIFIIAVIVFVFINNSKKYLDYIGEKSAAALEERYGKVFNLLNVEKRGLFSAQCVLSTEDDLTVYCNCNLFGTVTAESYANYNYAPDRVKEIDNIIDGRLTEYKSKLSFMRFLREKDDGLELLPVNSKDSTSYTEYKKLTADYNKKILIFIPEDTDTTVLAKILNDLKDSEVVRDNYIVLFKQVPRAVFDEIDDFPAIPEHSDVYNPQKYQKELEFDYFALLFEPLNHTVAYFNYDGKTELIKQKFDQTKTRGRSGEYDRLI